MTRALVPAAAVSSTSAPAATSARAVSNVAVARREEQRRRAAVPHAEVSARIGVAGGVLELLPDPGAGVQVGAARGQQAHDVGVLLSRRPHQRGLAAFALRRVHVGPVVDEHLWRAASVSRAASRAL